MQDLQALVALEQTCFATDRMSPRQIRHWINHAGGYFLIAAADSQLAGAALGISRRNSKFVRLYSLAVLPTFRGRGIGSCLLEKIESLALESGKLGMRLEVRADHSPAIALYGSMGYDNFGVLPDYYEDHTDALRMQKFFIKPPRDGLINHPG